MRIEILPPDKAVGHILCHNLADANGHKAFTKGHRVRSEDLPYLTSLGRGTLRVAVLDPGDTHEDEAAARLGIAVAGPGVEVGPPYAGRVNLRAARTGPLVIDTTALLAVNELDGLTVATLPDHSLVQIERTLATIKVIPFAVPGATLEHAEALGKAASGILQVRAMTVRMIGVILVSSPAARRRVEHGVYPAISGRVQDLGGQITSVQIVPPDEQVLAATLAKLRQSGAGLIIIAGETSVVDSDDVAPRAVRLAGGWVEHYGAPVEPGNLLLMAYLGDLPILGAPGCVRSRDANIVDLLLPRLMAGERISRKDIVRLGHGGLLLN